MYVRNVPVLVPVAAKEPPGTAGIKQNIKSRDDSTPECEVVTPS